MAALDSFGPHKALGLVAAWSGVSPENLVLTIVASLACSEATHLKNVYAEGLEPGQQPLQSRKVGKLAVQDGLDRLHGSAQVLKVE
jgi:hypothetical protein